VLGEGGMGAVYEAEQHEPVRRSVALKVVRPGLGSGDAVARFEAERQALALMDHPNIAKVLDAGTTPWGQPYFVMELVDGLPVTAYCDRHKLSIAERLRLFCTICEAVQHAHQKGVMHRDLKPSNVLVRDLDGAPAVKVIDFGIAKAIGTELTDSTLHTDAGQRLGTPAYMSPEQWTGGGDIDTRADVYALGVLLYELLVGALPVDTASFEDPRALVRWLEERTSVPALTARLKTFAPDRRATIAEERRSDPRGLERQLSGDLEWIVRKAINADRTERYATAHDLALDIGRFIDQQPVFAGPPSNTYRLRKFVRRNRVLVGAAAVVLLALFVGLGSAVTGLVRARRAERQARLEAASTQQVTDFLVNLFKTSDPGEARGNTMTAREVLDKGATLASSSLAGQPALRVRMLTTLGTVYYNLGLYQRAIKLAMDAVHTAERLPDGEKTLASALELLGRSQNRRGDFVGGEASLTRSLAIRARVLPSGDPAIADASYQLGILRFYQSRYAEARTLFQRALAIREAALGPRGEDVGRTLGMLGAVASQTGDYPQAERLFKRELAILEPILGPDHFDVAGNLSDLAIVEKHLKHYDEAERLFRRAIAIRDKIYGADVPPVAAGLFNLGEMYVTLDRFADAEPLLRRAYDIDGRAIPDSLDLAEDATQLGMALAGQGKYVEAAPVFAQALAIQERKAGRDKVPPGLLAAYARTLRALGRSADANKIEARVPHSSGATKQKG
jgi:non-specific serine/threonine protein kinase/serine/threonine-protein kinase